METLQVKKKLTSTFKLKGKTYEGLLQNTANEIDSALLGLLRSLAKEEKISLPKIENKNLDPWLELFYTHNIALQPEVTYDEENNRMIVTLIVHEVIENELQEAEVPKE